MWLLIFPVLTVLLTLYYFVPQLAATIFVFVFCGTIYNMLLVLLWLIGIYIVPQKYENHFSVAIITLFVVLNGAWIWAIWF